MSDDEEDGMAKTLAERFWSKVLVDVSTQCHEWQAATFHSGYGAFWHEGKTYRAHRMAWFLEYGRWPEHTLDHLCRTRACVNPDHLEDVPHEVNVARGESGSNYSSRTHCGNGHEFTPENTYLRPDSGGARRCRECAREYVRRHHARKKAQNGA